MSLIPVSAAAVAPKVPAGRPGASVKSQPPIAPSRTHAAARGNAAAAAGKSAKARGGFASVLESVQQDAGHAETRRTRTAAASSVRVSVAEDVRAEPRRSQDVSSEPDASRVVQPATPVVAAQTPWLLLALGSGSCSWQETADSGDRATGEPAAADETAAGIDAGVESVALVGLLSPVPNAVPLAATAVDATTVLSAPAALSDATPMGEIGVEAARDAREATIPLARTSAGASATPSDVLPDELGAKSAETAPELSATDQPASSVGAKGSVSAAAVPAAVGDVAVHPATASKESTSGAVAPSEIPLDSTRQSARPTNRPASWLGQQARTADTASVAPSAAAGVIERDAAGAAPAQLAVQGEAFRIDDARPTAAVLGRKASHEASAFTAVPQLPQVEVSLPASVREPAPSSLPPAVGDQVLNQIVTSVRMQWKDGIGEARLHLRPDALGTVNVSLKVEAGAVTAVVRADSPEVQEWVVKHQETLRQQMEAAGLNLAELVVNPDDRGQTRQEAPPQQRRPRQAVMAAQTRRFEELL